jgi:Domain of unknown function (DUF4352)
MSRASFVTRFPASIAFCALIAVGLLAAGCSSTAKKEAQTVPAGEKATVGPLVYSVIDSQVLTQLGDEAATARTPRNRFYVMTISVSNSSTEDAPIPGLTLVDDTGKEYPEVADGTNVPNWLGIVRKAGGAQTEQGNIVFDAPAQHYRLRLTDETDAKELSIDVPLTYLHEQLKEIPSTSQQTAVQPLIIPEKKK